MTIYNINGLQKNIINMKNMTQFLIITGVGVKAANVLLNLVSGSSTLCGTEWVSWDFNESYAGGIFEHITSSLNKYLRNLKHIYQ